MAAFSSRERFQLLRFLDASSAPCVGSRGVRAARRRAGRRRGAGGRDTGSHGDRIHQVR